MISLIVSKDAPSVTLSKILPFKSAESLSKKLKPEMDRIFNNQSLSNKEKIKKSFEAYVRIRLARLTRSQRERINGVLKDRLTVVTDTSGQFDSFFDQYTFSVMISLPPQYMESIVNYFFLVHEIEHAIQMLSATNDAHPLLDPYRYIDFRFEAEKGAMTAEGVYLLSLPKSVVQIAALQISQDASLNAKQTRNLLLSMTEGTTGEHNVEGYVNMQWRDGRYTKENIERYSDRPF